MSQKQKSDESPFILLLGCPELRLPLRRRGFSTTSVRSFRQLTHPKEDLHARSIILGPNAIRDQGISDIVAHLRETWPMVDIIAWGPKASASVVRKLLRAGARDIVMSSSAENCAQAILKIVEAQKLLPRAARLPESKDKPDEFEGMFARSKKMWDLFDTATQIAKTDTTVLILGETGTGKELLARAIHHHSERDGRFVPVNCGAINPTLVDSELFGHVRGAFTGANVDKEGLFKHADGGTLLLDEIGNVPLSAQYHLLRALQEGAVRPVGASEEVPVNVRVIAATSNALEDDVQSGKFREDLFYRLDVIRLTIPSLRERPEDIIFLFAHFAKRIAKDYNVERPDLREDFLDAMMSYEWPGNVRQLENFTERLVLTHTGTRVGAEAFARLLPFQTDADNSSNNHLVTRSDLAVDAEKPMSEALAPHIERLELKYLKACLEKAQGRMGEAADIAGVSRRTLLRKLKQYSIDRTEFRNGH